MVARRSSYYICTKLFPYSTVADPILFSTRHVSHARFAAYTLALNAWHSLTVSGEGLRDGESVGPKDVVGLKEDEGRVEDAGTD